MVVWPFSAIDADVCVTWLWSAVLSGQGKLKLQTQQGLKRDLRFVDFADLCTMRVTELRTICVTAGVV